MFITFQGNKNTHTLIENDTNRTFSYSDETRRNLVGFAVSKGLDENVLKLADYCLREQHYDLKEEQPMAKSGFN